MLKSLNSTYNTTSRKGGVSVKKETDNIKDRKDKKDFWYYAEFKFAADILSSGRWLALLPLIGGMMFLFYRWVKVGTSDFAFHGDYYAQYYAAPLGLFIFSMFFIMYIAASEEETVREREVEAKVEANNDHTDNQDK